MNPTDVHHSTVVITGVTRGLGRAMVDEFVHLGRTVFGCARTGDEIEALRRMYPRHDFQTVDVASNAEVKTWAERDNVDATSYPLKIDDAVAKCNIVVSKAQRRIGKSREDTVRNNT